MESMIPVRILKIFFGQREGQTIHDFAKEIKELGDDKREIVELAAAEMEVEVNWG